MILKIVKVSEDSNSFNYEYYCTKTKKCISRTDNKLVIKNEVVELGEKSFSYFKKPFDLRIPNNVIIISKNAFEDSMVKKVCFDKDAKVTKIPLSAFFGAVNLIKINIPSRVKVIESTAFKGTKNLKEVIFDSNSELERISDSAFSNAASLESIVIPKSVVSIGSSAFAYNERLRIVTFESGSNPKAIESKAFLKAKELERIVIPSSVEYIGYDAFCGCEHLTIFCELKDKPSEWDYEWNISNRPVYWKDCWQYDENGNPQASS
ncbi:MAG: leucine-rich repeat domain-containing protein [Bacilli bacterium]